MAERASQLICQVSNGVVLCMMKAVQVGRLHHFSRLGEAGRWSSNTPLSMLQR